jgi:hypothetical protein
VTAITFNGFDEPFENWSKLPHSLINALPLISTIAEMKVILYILRHTWGFKEFDLPKRITVDEFIFGRKDKHGNRMDNGTGLTEPSVRAGLEKATEHGFITVFMDDSDLARIVKAYMLKLNDQGEKVLPSDYAIGGKSFTVGTENSLPRSEKETKGKKLKKKEPRKPKWFDEDQLIDVWAGIRKLNAIAMGADYHTDSDRRLIKKMLAWTKPITADEIREAMKRSKHPAYPIIFLERDVIALRSEKPAAVHPSHVPFAPVEVVPDAVPMPDEARAAMQKLAKSVHVNDEVIHAELAKSA